MAQPNRSNFEQTELGRSAIDQFGRSISMPEGNANDLGLVEQGTYTQSLNPNGQINNDATNQKLNRPTYASNDDIMYYPEELGYTDRLADSPTNIMKFTVLDFEGGLLKQEGSVLTESDINETVQSVQGESLIDTISNVFSQLNLAGSKIGDLSKKITSNTPTVASAHKDVIYLYTPEDITTNYGFNYKDDDLTPTYKALDMISGSDDQKKDIMKQAGVGFINSILKSAAGTNSGFGKTVGEIGKISNIGLGGDIDLAGIIRAKTRATPIQNLEYLFENVVRRQFNFTFKFYPKSQKEIEMVGRIIAAFKFYAHPNLNADTPRYLGFPSVFQIEHMSWTPEKKDAGKTYSGGWAPNLFVNQYKTAALNSIQVDYTDVGAFSTLEALPQDKKTLDGVLKSPVGIKLTLDFQELRILNRNDMTDPKDFLKTSRGVNDPNRNLTDNPNKKNSRYH